MGYRKRFNHLMTVLAYLSPEALAVVRDAYQFSKTAHKGQKRASGKQYINHPIEVAIILAELKQDVVTIVASLLHDTLEDTSVSKAAIDSEFGPHVLNLVEGVTKLGKVNFVSSKEAQAENYRRMFLAMAEDLRVIIIKLADRLHNMRTLACLLVSKQRRIARETLDIFAPLANRLGMGSMKWEFEDLALFYLKPKVFQDIKNKVALKREEREQHIETIVERVKTLLDSHHIDAEITGRPKHFYSIYKKMQITGAEYDDLFDLIGIRIIPQSVQHCYEILGLIHSVFKPLQGRIKDYIAMPKTNLYQSLHTTVMGPLGNPVEIQIRTQDMHNVSELGIASHWKYKEQKGTSQQQFREEFDWLRYIIDAQQETDPSQYIDTIKMGLFSEEVFVFTPKGDVQVLSHGATPLDFAYKIHTEIGHRYLGAKIDGRIVSMSTSLKSGDQVDIITAKYPNPKLSWLNVVTTRQAKSRIKAWFRKQSGDANIKKGRAALERVLIQEGYSDLSIIQPEKLAPFLEKRKIPSLESFFILIAQGDLSPYLVIKFLNDTVKISQEVDLDQNLIQKLKSKQTKTSSVQGVRVMGEDNILANLAKCCSPMPGDDIMGFVTMGYGVTVHRSECANITKIPAKNRARLVDVEWTTVSSQAVYPVLIQIEAFHRKNLLNDVVAKVIDENTNILKANSQERQDGHVQFKLQLELKDRRQFDHLMKRLLAVPDVLSVRRLRRAW